MGLAVIASVSAGLWLLLRPVAPPDPRATVSELTDNTSVNSSAFKRAIAPVDFVFPRDHGPHPDFQTEWWYYTGNLTDPNGRHFGYQLTFFRRALLPAADIPERSSQLAASQLYFAHFAVTDAGAGRHMAVERFSRGAGHLADAGGNPIKVYLENWSATDLNNEGTAVRLSAQDGAYGIALDLNSSKPIALHGNHGLSAKSAEPGNASYYYSFTRMESTGSIQTPDGTYAVTGQSWMDHEWSTSALGPNARGWDWFALQLSDQRELMLYRFRNMDGSIDAVSGGTVVLPDGSTQILQRDQIQIDVQSTWRSLDNGAEYPSRWRIRIPDADIDLIVEPRINDQQNNLSIVYWEGAVKVSGTSHQAAVEGVGYVELTGYLSSINGKF
ncbi:MAG TPA: lipocalin-like domain-containing protein [Anaerolineae bacterium]